MEILDALTPIAVSLFAVQDNAGTTDYFDVAAAGVTISPQLDVDNLNSTSILYPSSVINSPSLFDPHDTNVHDCILFLNSVLVLGFFIVIVV